MKPSPREIKEAKKAYDKVVDHLISEDYARTKEDADQIISGMSEDWYYLILQSQWRPTHILIKYRIEISYHR